MRVAVDRTLGQKNNISLSQKEILLPFAIDFSACAAPKIFAKQKCEQVMEFA
jgi:hypothetical protein